MGTAGYWVWGPVLLPSGASDRECGGHWPLDGIALRGRGDVFAHVGATGVDPDRVVDDPVHDRVGVDASAEAVVPVFLRVLGAEHGRAGVVTPLEEFQEHGPHCLVGWVQKPLVDHEEGERRVFPQELRGALGLVLRQCPGLGEVGHPDVVGPDPVLAGLLRERASEIRLPGPGEPLEHDVLVTGDE